MAVIQPGIKSVFAKNIKRTPLLLSYATFILNIDAPAPIVQATNGSYRFRYKADTGKMELSTDNGQTYSGDHSVTSDGSTFNSNVGSSRLDFILQPNPNEGDEFEAVIKDGVAGEDTTLRLAQNSQEKNYGSTDNVSVGSSFNKGIEALIRFNIQTYFLSLFGTEGDSLFGRTISSFIRVRSISSPVNQNVQFFPIADSDGDWIEGTANGATQTGSPDWNHKVHDTVNWAGGVGTPELEGGAITEEINITGTIFYILNDQGGRLNKAIDRWLKTTLPVKQTFFVNNGIRTVAPHLNSIAVFASSENSTGDWRPLLCFIYQADAGENHGGAGGGFGGSGGGGFGGLGGGPGGLGGPGGDKEIDLATTLGDVGGSSDLSSTPYGGNFYTDERAERFREDLLIADELDDTYATEFGSQE